MLVPETPPPWSCRVVDGLVVWDFLPDSWEPLPWLVIHEQQGPFGLERVAIPRLVQRDKYAAETEKAVDKALAGEAVPSLQVVTVEALVEAEREAATARTANEPPTLARRLAVLLVADLYGRSIEEIARWTADDPGLEGIDKWSALVDRQRRNAKRRAEHDRSMARKLVGRFGGLPFAAFPDGKLPKGWWHAPEVVAALDVWRRTSLPSAVTMPRPEWPSARRVVALLRCRHDDGQPPLPPETMAVARDVLERDARASDARTSVEQWVMRLGFSDPWKVLDEELNEYPVLGEAWARAARRPVR